MSLYLRFADPGDLPAILALDPLAQRPESGREAFIHHAIFAKSCWLAVLDEAAAGYGVLDYSFYKCGFISLVYVHSDYRRRGVGAALLAGLEKVCQTPKLFTSTNASNLPMQALLARQGFVQSGIIHHLDEGDPEIVYFKRLVI